jgi:hypothetical protein
MALEWFLVTAPLYLVAGWVATTWIRAKHGYPLAGGVRKAAADGTRREAALARLEARVRVLERIATDRPAQLRDELDAMALAAPAVHSGRSGARHAGRPQARDA